MHRTIAAAVIALVAASSASSVLADDITVETTPFVSTSSRAQVNAQLQQFRQAGVDPWAQHYDQLAALRSSRTRAQVRADYLQSRQETAALTAEDSGSAWLAARAHGVAASLLAGTPASGQ
ncbi:DUF4148 domain-containing protein [Ramlibacter alkalitolerans]|uniref:DUF4148 domain-containing protein n=1 Tax=Ramlibacter alkalitolerans TaxID=2039631 RepID=A0ABS1JTA8_9BURK|nr:DUF4148 domain-containing protein [Ramlibacter alkalitolerans]MBL0427510.1 DUF4148 domain-containing protein [Ramlibacter alkalitolerans]